MKKKGCGKKKDHFHVSSFLCFSLLSFPSPLVLDEQSISISISIFRMKISLDQKEKKAFAYQETQATPEQKPDYKIDNYLEQE